MRYCCGISAHTTRISDAAVGPDFHKRGHGFACHARLWYFLPLCYRNHQQDQEMNIEDFRDYCLSMDGVTEKTPFGKFARRYDSILVFYVLDHMFCFVDMDDFTSVTVKSTPDEVDEIRMVHSSVSNPINRSLHHWIQLNLNGDISNSEIYTLVKRAYYIVKAKYTGKTK
ncbi:MmcQ/YjbR family DNA-binding protein [Muribaculum intestinale]|uniref:MmcQ/YjbR family DNA-binding protein n=2 Tax=Muribaculum intestinale TaxID=1796646 RepID=UPI0025A6167D|nr:MmcQ/YjbR family DNA-binding protein [Muribaculum intestinale]